MFWFRVDFLNQGSEIRWGAFRVSLAEINRGGFRAGQGWLQIRAPQSRADAPVPRAVHVLEQADFRGGRGEGVFSGLEIRKERRVVVRPRKLVFQADG